MDSQQTEWPATKLLEKAQGSAVDILSEAFANLMDEDDPLARFRQKFSIPQKKIYHVVIDEKLVNLEDECVYLCGNSLGPKPKSADHHMAMSLDAWAKWGVLSHFHGTLPAAKCDLPGIPATARIIGAKPNEVALMNGLTVNLHLLLVSFYRPSESRYKILMEAKAFPSDRYAIKSQVRHHGYDPKETVIQLAPRKGEHCLRTEDILKTIEAEGDSIAVVLFSGVQFYTGQKFEMQRITDAGHSKGCIVGFDLAHAVGNVKLNVHEWGVDFACWCSYKYMNSGAGGLAGAFIHEKHNQTLKSEFHGWWSNILETRFDMNEGELTVIFEETSMDDMLAKQFLLTGYLEYLLDHHFKEIETPILTILTPRDPQQRGCQLSLQFLEPIEKVHEELEKRGVLCDIRKPDVLRIAPAPLFNTFLDVYHFVHLFFHDLYN
uniref:Kynureninase n=1 Tax=Strigamia maritima TaxID=126957 RepID=T1JA67_STRMM